MLNTQYHGNHRRVPKMNELRRKIKCFIGTGKSTTFVHCRLLIRNSHYTSYRYGHCTKKIILLIVSVVMVKNRNIELSTTFINLKFLCLGFKEYLTYFNELLYRTNHYFDIFCNVSHSLIGEKIVLTKPTLYYYKMTSIQYWLHLGRGNKLNICRQGNSDEDQFASTSFLCTLLKVLIL